MSFLGSAGFRVGALVVGISALVAYMSMQLSQDMDFSSDAQKFWFVTDSADGLLKNGQVKMAGIPVGQVTRIQLRDGKAQVDIRVDGNVPVRESAAVLLQASGVLGDRHVELFPGDPSDPPLGYKQQIKNVQGSGSISTVLGQVSEIAGSLKATADSLSKAVQGEGNRNDVLGRILLNVEALTSDLAEMSSSNKKEVNQIIDRLSSITQRVDEIMTGDGEDGFDAGWERLLASLERLEASAKNLQEITDKVNSGEGTIGRLVNDESTVDELNAAIDNVNSFLGGASRMETSIDFGSEYYTGLEEWKSYIGVKIQPGLDRFYLLRIVDDPSGVLKTTEVRNTDGSGSESFQRSERTSFSDVKFTALFGKNIHNWTLKGGLYESSAGLGADYHFWSNRFTASVMAYELANANLKTSLSYQPFRGLFVTGGMNDVLDNSQGFSSYFGAGILLTNDDLKLLLSGSAF